MLPTDREKDVFIEAIDHYEETLLGVHRNKVSRQDREAVQLLQYLYGLVRMNKKLVHKHDSELPAYQDYTDHKDSMNYGHNDYDSVDCGGWPDHEDYGENSHSDHRADSDIAHDDYYILGE